MFANKFFILAALGLALGILSSYGVRAVEVQDESSHHLIIGSRLPGDRLTISGVSVQKESKWLQKVIAERTFQVPFNQNITEVQCIDQKTNGKGAYATVTYGGPGWNHVDLRFKSQRGHGINFKVYIYSK